MNDSRLPSIVSTGIDEEVPWRAVARHRFGTERRYVNHDLPKRCRATATPRSYLLAGTKPAFLHQRIYFRITSAKRSVCFGRVLRVTHGKDVLP